tara:strand:+ start:978 stop:2210 length:1233 start_codon:yes stop_codon:yes gene_type:complete
MSTSISATEIGLPDNAKLKLGTGEDLEIFHNGSHSYIDNTGTGNLYIKDAGIVRIRTASFGVDNADGSEALLSATANGAVELYYDNVKMIETTSTGTSMPDGKFAKFGASNDLTIGHNTFNYITYTGADFLITGDNTNQVKIMPRSDEPAAIFKPNGEVELYYDNNLRLETTTGGVDITGSTDGVLNIDTTDGRGSFIRFKQSGGSKCFVGCAEGLGVGDQDDLSLRATDRVFIQTGGSSETMRLGRSGSHAQVFVNCTETFSNAVFSMQTNGTTGIGLKAGATNQQFMINFRNPNGEVGTINTSGSSTSYNTSSDYRLKENAVAISDGITRLKTLKPYRFNFKTDASTTVDGFFAHEVTAVPEAITGTKDEVDSDNNPVYQGIDQSKLVPLLVAAVQELAAKVEALEAA